MNSLERVTLCLQHKEADRVPVYPLINSVSRKTVGISYETWTKDVPLCAESIIRATDELDLDVICTLTDLSVEAADFGQELLYFEDKAACPNDANRLIKDVEDYQKLKKIDGRETPRMREHLELCKRLVAAKGNEKPIVAFLFGPLGILSMLRGQEDMFCDLYEEPDSVKAGVEVITETLLDYIDAVCETGVHAIMFDTLYSSKSILSKDMWDEFEGEAVQRLAQRVHDNGKMVMIHNCGNGVYFDAQIKRMHPEAISFLHIPDDCSSYEQVKEKYGDQTTLIGYIDPGFVMTASEEEVYQEAVHELDVMKKGGGFILATGCEYPAPLDFAKAKAIVRAAKEHGKYA